MTIYKPVNPRKAFQIAQNPTLVAPEVPDGIPVTYDQVDSILLPLTVSNADLKVVVNWWPTISPDLYIFIEWNGTVDLASVQAVTPAQVADPTSTWEFTIPASAMTVHGRYPIRYVTSVVDFALINEVFSERVYVLVDRVAPGGEALPYLEIFPTDPEKKTITEADLTPDGKLVATVADYFEMREFDEVTPWIGLHDGSGEFDTSEVEIVDDDEVGTRKVFVRFTRALLEKYGDGPVAFSYKLKDRAGNESVLAPTVEFDVLLETAPGNFLPPRVPANDDGLITDTDARVPVTIDIPPYDNAATGDRVTVHWGNLNLPAQTVLVPDPPAPVPDPLLSIPISYADLKAGSPGAVPVTVNVSYTVQRANLPFPTSPSTPVKVDLTLAGGEDPDPGTPEHENIKAPDVRDASLNLNRIAPENYGKDASITVPWKSVDGSDIFVQNDIVRVYWGARPNPFITQVVFPLPTQDYEFPVPAAIITGDAVGERPVWYTITRNLSTLPHTSTAKSQVQTVLVETNLGHPGDGQPLAKPTFPEARGTPPLIDRAAGLDGTTVRCPLTDTNIAANDTVVVVFQGFDSFDGTGVPKLTFTSPARSITGAELAAGAIIIDIPSGTMRQLCRGSANAQYTVTNSQGSGVSESSDSVRVILFNATDPVCALP